MTRILVDGGSLRHSDVVQVVIKEGTRWHQKMGCYKVGMHFIFNVLLTRRQFRAVWESLLADISASAPFVGKYIRGEMGKGYVITREDMGASGEVFALVGADVSSYQNMEQGLALPGSR